MYKYKKYIWRHGHPLAKKNGKVKESRYVIYEKLKGNSGNCNWCKEPLTWKTLCADHLDSDIMNNSPDNLVGSCRGCNANRDDGTGYGRRKPKKCRKCGKSFICKHQATQIYCSNKCARQCRIKRGTKAEHGTRTRYVFGCRCILCVKCNTNYSRINYFKTARYKKVLKDVGQS